MSFKLHAEELPTCPILHEVGNYHFEGRCEDHDVRALARLNLGQVEDRFHAGRVTRDEFEAYMCVWAALSPAQSGGGWREAPEDLNVRRIARKLLRVRGLELPASLVDERPASCGIFAQRDAAKAAKVVSA